MRVQTATWCDLPSNTHTSSQNPSLPSSMCFLCCIPDHLQLCLVTGARNFILMPASHCPNVRSSTEFCPLCNLSSPLLLTLWSCQRPHTLLPASFIPSGLQACTSPVQSAFYTIAREVFLNMGSHFSDPRLELPDKIQDDQLNLNCRKQTKKHCRLKIQTSHYKSNRGFVYLNVGTPVSFVKYGVLPGIKPLCSFKGQSLTIQPRFALDLIIPPASASEC